MADVKGINSGLDMFEAKCIEVDNKQATVFMRLCTGPTGVPARQLAGKSYPFQAVISVSSSAKQRVSSAWHLDASVRSLPRTSSEVQGALPDKISFACDRSRSCCCHPGN